jgi:hypothetical protein
VLKEEGRLIHLQEPSDEKWLQLPSNTHKEEGYFAERYMGLVRVGDAGGIGACLEDGDGGWRRLDITIYERKCFVYGLFQWTGSTQLNREMRRKSLRLGYVVNEFGIFHNVGSVKPAPGDPVQGSFDLDHPDGERGIFKLVQMDYLEPHERNAGSRSGLGGGERKGGVGNTVVYDSDSDDGLLCCMDD